MDALGCDFTIATPGVSRTTRRTVFKGHLFVGDVLLSESGMRNHPLTPMTDANLVRVLQAQLARRATARGRASAWSTTRGRRVAPRRSRERFDALRADGVAHRDRRRRSPTTTCCASARRFATCRWSAPARAWRSACRANFGHRARRPRGGVAAAGAGLARDRLGQLLAGDQRAGRASSCAAAARRAAVDPLALAATATTRLAAGICAWAARAWPAAPSAGARLHHRAAAGGRGGAGAARRAHDVGARVERAARRHRARPGRARRAPARRRRRRDLGRVRAGARRRAAAHRRARSIPACPGATPAPALRRDGLHLALKSGNFGGVDFFAKAFDGGVRMSEARAARRDLPRRPLAASSAATCTARPATSARGCDGGFLITPTDACLGYLDPAALSQVDAAGVQRRAASAPSKTLALHRRIYAAEPPRPAASSTPTRTHLRARSRLPRGESRDDLLPPITPYFVMKVGHVPLIAYRRPGRPGRRRRGRRGDRAAAAPRRADPRRDAVAARPERLARDARRRRWRVLEELEETARLWLGCEPQAGAADAGADRRAAPALRRALVNPTRRSRCRASPPT